MLVDAGSYVEVQSKTFEAIEEAQEYVDGTIVGHAWVSFEVPFEPKQERIVEARYAIPDTHVRFVEFALDRLDLYTEKFWYGETVPLIELRFGVAGAVLDKDVLVPTGEYAQYTIPPSDYDAGAFVWRITDYAPNKEPYTYVTHILHPFAVDREALEKAYGTVVPKADIEPLH